MVRAGVLSLFLTELGRQTGVYTLRSTSSSSSSRAMSWCIISVSFSRRFSYFSWTIIFFRRNSLVSRNVSYSLLESCSPRTTLTIVATKIFYVIYQINPNLIHGSEFLSWDDDAVCRCQDILRKCSTKRKWKKKHIDRFFLKSLLRCWTLSLLAMRLPPQKWRQDFLNAIRLTIHGYLLA